MNKTAIALTCSLVLLVLAILLTAVFRGGQDFRGKIDRLEPTKRPDVARAATENGSRLYKEQSPAYRSEQGNEHKIPQMPGVLQRYLTFQCTVLFNKQPISGAQICARLQRLDADGTPASVSLYFDPVSGVESDQNGLVVGGVSYPDGADVNSMVAVFAYTPEFGLAYDQYTLEELSKLSAQDLVFELKSEASVRGIVVDADGGPVADAVVCLYTACTSGINLTGLSCVTREDGTFELQGMSFENTPVAVVASHGDARPRLVRRADEVLLPEEQTNRFSEGQKPISGEFFDSGNKVWDVGEIRVATVAVEPAEKAAGD